MFSMRYRVPENLAGLPALVELEMDGSFHVNKVWLVLGDRRIPCKYEPTTNPEETPLKRPA